MADARLGKFDMTENPAAGPGVFTVLITWWLITAPNDVKISLLGTLPYDDFASELAAFATANTLTWL